jgi:hypothetical protein
MIVAPDEFAGRTIGSGFTLWAARTFDDEDAEAALVLRRGAFLSIGRNPEAIDPPHAPRTGACWVQQAERNEQAVKMAGSRQDFSDSSYLLTAGDEDWIRFAGP